MAAAKPEVLVSQLLHEILTKFQRYCSSIHNGSIEKLDPDYVGVAFGIMSLSYLEVELCLGSNLPPPPQVPACVAKIQVPGRGLTVNVSDSCACVESVVRIVG